MVIGLDFDNTIVSYDALFYRMAFDKGAIPSEIFPTKTAVRNYLRKTGQEDLWVNLQSQVYGAHMKKAVPFPGAREFLLYCQQAHISVYVVSHKTQYPYGGKRYDLHQAALAWMKKQEIIHGSALRLTEERVFFEPTITAKCQRIESLGCQVFLDDLPEFLLHTDFPASVHPIGFDPYQQYESSLRLQRVRTWFEFQDWVDAEWQSQILASA